MATNKDWTKWRRQTLAVRGGQKRSPFQETSEALYLTSGYAYEGPGGSGGALQGRARLHLYALCQSDDFHLRRAHGAARRRARRACDRVGHGGGHLDVPLLPESRRSCGGGARAVRRDPLRDRGRADALRHHEHHRGRHRSRGLARRRCAPRRNSPSSRRRPIRRSKSSISQASPTSRTKRAPAWWSTTPSPRRRCSGRWSSAPISWCIPRPNISTARAARWAASFCARKISSKTIFRSSCAIPGRAMSPFNAWVHLKSLETLDLRMREHCRNASQSPIFLPRRRTSGACSIRSAKTRKPARANHPQIALAKKQMSGGGGVVTFEVAGGKKEAFKVAKALKLVDVSNNLGDTEEPAHPSGDDDASAPHARKRGSPRASPTACCAFRSAWKTPPICATTLPRRWRRSEEAAMEHHATIAWQRTSATPTPMRPTTARMNGIFTM